MSCDDQGQPIVRIKLSYQHSTAGCLWRDIRELVTPVIADVMPDGWMVARMICWSVCR